MERPLVGRAVAEEARPRPGRCPAAGRPAPPPRRSGCRRRRCHWPPGSRSPRPRCASSRPDPGSSRSPSPSSSAIIRSRSAPLAMQCPWPRCVEVMASSSRSAKHAPVAEASWPIDRCIVPCISPRAKRSSTASSKRRIRHIASSVRRAVVGSSPSRTISWQLLCTYVQIVITYAETLVKQVTLGKTWTQEGRLRSGCRRRRRAGRCRADEARAATAAYPVPVTTIDSQGAPDDGSGRRVPAAGRSAMRRRR